MELYILDKDFIPIVMLDQCESVLWYKRYNDIGECEIYVGCDNELLDILKLGYYIRRVDDNMICQIVERQITTSINDGDFLTVKGLSAINILSGRIIWSEVNFIGKVVEFIKAIINLSIAGNASSRIIRNMVVDDSNFDEFVEESTFQIKQGEDLLQVIKDTCVSYGYGFEMIYEDDTLKFRIYKGIDRSSTTNDTYVEFSEDYSNILNTSYDENIEAYKNVALVRGKEHPGSLEIPYREVIIGNPTGIDRRELFVDCSGIEWTYTDENDVEKTYTISEYNQILIENGNQALANASKSESFSGEVETQDTYVYKVDYNLGDYVKVINEYGISANAQIVEVLESNDLENGYQVEPTFDYKGVD